MFQPFLFLIKCSAELAFDCSVMQKRYHAGSIKPTATLWWPGSVEYLLLKGREQLIAFYVSYEEDICVIYIKCQCIIKEKMMNWSTQNWRWSLMSSEKVSKSLSDT